MDSRLRGIADYLLAQTSASTVDPHLIDPELLPHVFILDVERDVNVRLRIRLAGTALDEVFRRPLTGHLLEEFIHGPRGADVIASFHHCARTREPLWMRQIVHMKERAPRFVEGVAVYLVPERIYGGLVIGELTFPGVEAGFERTPLPQPP
jgi:hypothetical protein